MIKIYYKPDCSTCKTALALINETTSEEQELVEYLITAPGEEEIKQLLQMLGIKAEQLVRKKEKLYQEKYKDKKISNARWIKILSKNPVLIERPIVVYGDKAVIGRPPETIVNFLKKN